MSIKLRIRQSRARAYGTGGRGRGWISRVGRAERVASALLAAPQQLVRAVELAQGCPEPFAREGCVYTTWA